MMESLSLSKWEAVPLILLISILTGVATNPNCVSPKPGMLNVHLVCHTHDDVGWLKTVDQYYYGAKNEIQRAGVQYILDSVVKELLEDSAKKFIYVESAFFFRWWNQQKDPMKEDVKVLVEEGRLEFINGGWCMNDEAATHYNAIIDQMTLGMASLNDTFGSAARPRIAWQIDPFGHSREQASLFAQMGFDGLFFGRLDYADKSQRWNTKTLEMVWQASQSLGERSSLFTGVLPNGYSPPAGFCYDILCTDKPIMDDPRMKDYNVDKIVSAFLSVVADQAQAYASFNIIITMGEDFNFQNADMWYKNLDKLIRYANERQINGSNVNVFYSTPSCYLDALHASNLTWPTKTDDFFPYASDPHSYWTGYFTSRPTLKGYVRTTNAYLQAAKQVYALAGLGRHESLQQLIRAMGVLQHHDAVSGTAKQYVTNDYSQRLSDAVSVTFEHLTQNLPNYQTTEATEEEEAMKVPKSPTFLCPLINISSCPTTETSNGFVVTLYNQLAKNRTHAVRLPVPADAAYKVMGPDGTFLDVQLVPIPEPVLSTPGRNSSATFELVFLAKNLPPLGFFQYHVQRTNASRAYKQQLSSTRVPGPKEQVSIGHKGLAAAFDSKTGLMKSIAVTTPDGTREYKGNQTFLWYHGMSGAIQGQRASGAYIFRPNDTYAQNVTNGPVQIVRVNGTVVMEVHQVWSPWVSQVTRVYSGSQMVELEWLVGPIPILDLVGKEVVSRVIWSDFPTKGIFYTDANGRQMVKRKLNHRDTWTLNVTEPVAGNYYPVTSRLVIQSTNTSNTEQAALLNDRSQGGTSLGEGHLELMVHRRLLFDDGFGVGEALNETAFGTGLVVRGKHYILHSAMETPDCDFACLHRTAGEQIMMPPILTVTPVTVDAHTWQRNYYTSGSALVSAVPSNVHLLTLEPWGQDTLLIRLENMYEVGESFLSQPVTVNLQDLLAAWTITEARETTLAANQWLDESSRLHWDVQAGVFNENHIHHSHGKTRKERGHSKTKATADLKFTLNPMQIRTFIVTVQAVAGN